MTIEELLKKEMFRTVNPGEDKERYSRLALEHQIYITQMRTIQSSLEEYYMELKKRGV